MFSLTSMFLGSCRCVERHCNGATTTRCMVSPKTPSSTSMGGLGKSLTNFWSIPPLSYCLFWGASHLQILLWVLVLSFFHAHLKVIFSCSQGKSRVSNSRLEFIGELKSVVGIFCCFMGWASKVNCGWYSIMRSRQFIIWHFCALTFHATHATHEVKEFPVE